MVKAATAKRYENTRADTLGADVGRRLRTARKERGMSLAAVGQDDLSRSFLSLVELGRSRISLRALAIVAERLDMPLSYFLDDEVSVTDAPAELVLDRAEAALTRQEPAECLRILDESSIPEQMRLRATVLRGGALIDLRQPRTAVTVLAEGLETAERREDERFVLQLRYKLGLAFYTADDYESALTYLQKVINSEHDEMEDPELLGKATICVGHILYIRNETEEAIKQYARARDLFGTLSDMNSLACAYSGLSLAYERSGDLNNSLRYSKLSLGAFKALHNSRQAACELNNLAVRYHNLGDQAQARSCAEEAIACAFQLNAHDVEAAARSTLADILFQLNDNDAAKREAEKADQLATDQDLARVDARIILAKIAEQEDDHERADELYRWSLDTLKAMDHRAAFSDAALGYSLLLRQRGNTEGALDLALEAAHSRPNYAS